MDNFQNIPQELKTLQQWVGWKLTEVDGKLKKEPRIPGTNYRGSSTNPKHWRTFDVALSAYQRNKDKNDGIGFVFTKNENYVGIDIDDCVVSGELSDMAKDVIAMFDSYTEYSMSGTGIHIICKAEELRGDIDGRKDDPKGLEIYRRRHYFVMTGNILFPAKPINERQNVVYQFMDKYFPAEEERPQFVGQDVTTLPVTVNVSDADLIEKIRESKQGSKFSKLYYRGDYSDYHNKDGSINHSGGDQALADIIAWWTTDPAQIERILSASALGQRDKWKGNNKHSKYYRDRTIATAIENARKRGGGYNPQEYAKQMEEKRNAELIAALTARNAADTDDTDHEQLLNDVLYYELSEAGNAERLQRVYGSTWLYVSNNNLWFKWDGRRWSENNGSELTGLAIKLFRLLKQKAKEVFKEE